MFARDFRERAELKMQGKGSQAALAYLIVSIIGGGIGGITYVTDDPNTVLVLNSVGLAFSIFVLGPLIYGFYMYIAEIGKGNQPNIEVVFDGFKNYVNALMVNLLYSIYVFLWMLLLFIPGIIKAYAYSMAWYIMIENPAISSNDAITESRKMMDGNKWRLFCLHLSYIGWILIAILTFGIYFFWLAPKMELAKYEFYQDLKTRVN